MSDVRLSTYCQTLCLLVFNMSSFPFDFHCFCSIERRQPARTLSLLDVDTVKYSTITRTSHEVGDLPPLRVVDTAWYTLSCTGVTQDGFMTGRHGLSAREICIQTTR